MKYTGDNVLDTMANFAVNRNNNIYHQILDTFKISSLSKIKTILEFGAGRGEFIDRFLDNKNLKTYAVEIDKTYLNSLKRNHHAFFTLNHIPSKMDYIYTVDVLEHISDDLGMIKQLYQYTRENGLLFIYVPARPELYSVFDKNIGHYRRYLLDELVSKVKSAGYSIIDARYHDFFGYFAAVFNKFTSKGELNPTAVNFYDKYLFPISLLLEKLFRFPFGKSIILVAEKTTKINEKKRPKN